MSAAKDDVQALLSRLPDDCSLEDIQYHLYVIEKVRKGLESVGRGEGIPDGVAEQRLAEWLSD
ncbi:MAG: hypothetical protein QNJ00_03760 [Woeseiaceae bacterium]|nr:hypothetical protein [Woeseiaceae bacterium]